jgi:hypothetical protein
MAAPTGASERPDWSLAYILLFAIGAVALLALATAPVAALLGDSQYAIPSALHGVSATVFVVVSTVMVYLAYRLYTGQLTSVRDLRALAGLNAFFAAITVLFGNWIYIYYRAPAGPRAYFLENTPVIHEIFFEFKEFIALFTLPLSVAAAFVIWREGEGLRSRTTLREAVAVVLALSWLYLMLAFGLGAAITKLRGV